jgi:hypothetical protein
MISNEEKNIQAMPVFESPEKNYIETHLGIATFS